MCLVPAPLYTVCAHPCGSYDIVVISPSILYVECGRPCTLCVPAHEGIVILLSPTVLIVIL